MPEKPDIKEGDYHLIVNDRESSFNSEATLYRWDGSLVWKNAQNTKGKIACLAKGEHPDYTRRGGDTPPGVYKAGALTISQVGEDKRTWNAFGKYFIDLESWSGAEEKFYRAGVGIHGGGSAAPEPLAAYQQLCVTNGCIRFYNADLEKKILPYYQETRQKGTNFWVSVNQFK